ncbi:MAG: DUF2470 domain-containing protein [Pseudonocardia sp.]
MGTTRLRRPPAPSHAERARSAVARGGTAALVGTGCPIARPLVHHVRADGSAVLVLDDAAPVLDRVRAAERSGLAVMLEIADPAPVDLREPVRGLVWVTGWLNLPDAASARRLAVHVADVRPHPALLDVGSGCTLLRLVPGSIVLADAEGTAALTPVELAAARPDPFCRVEQQWLAHLEQAHPEVLRALARHLPPGLRDVAGARVRPLGVDRCGLRLRVETAERDHDVRLAWQRDALTQDELRAQLALLVHAGCPGANVRSTTPPRP